MCLPSHEPKQVKSEMNRQKLKNNLIRQLAWKNYCSKYYAALIKYQALDLLEPQQKLVQQHQQTLNYISTIPIRATTSNSNQTSVRQQSKAQTAIENLPQRPKKAILPILTHYLECTEPNCPWTGKNTFELTGHLVRVHQILQYRCLVRNCGRSYKSQ